jgi:tetratricopeptide (TPR) repeat protein
VLFRSLSENGDYDEACKYYAMCINFAADKKRYYEVSMVYMNLANTLVKQKKYIEAEEKFSKSLDLINKIPNIFVDTPLEGDVLINMAYLFEEKNEKDKEIEYLDKAILFYKNALAKHPEMESLIIKLNERKFSIS